MPRAEPTPMNFHEWTNADGEVLILRRIPQNRTTYNGFKWPSGVGSVVECGDFNPKPTCGGLHGWPLGFGLGEGMDYDIIHDVWLVLGAKPEDVVGELGGGAKCKIRRGVIRLEGTFGAAMEFVREGFGACVADMAKQCDGIDSTSASSGSYSTSASSGNGSTSASSGNDSKSASSGNGSTSEAIGQDTCAAAVGHGCRVKVGERGAFALPYYTDADGWRFLCGKVGEDGIKADTWYEILGGKLVEVTT